MRSFWENECVLFTMLILCYQLYANKKSQSCRIFSTVKKSLDILQLIYSTYTKIVYRNNSFSARFCFLENVQLSTLWIINALKTKILPLECSLSSSPVPVIISSPLLNNLISERRLIDVSSRLLLPQSRKCLINSLKDKNGNRRSHYRTNSLSLLFSFSLTIAFHPFISQELSNKR